MNKTPAVWIISDTHIDIWMHYGWVAVEPDLKQFYDPDRQNVYLILGDTINGLPMRQSKFFCQGFLRSVMKSLAAQGDVFFLLGNHEHYHGVFEDTKWRFTGFFDDIPNCKVIDTAECFFYEDTALLLGSNWPNLTAMGYMAAQTDQPAFMKDGALPVTFDDLAELGSLHSKMMHAAFGQIACHEEQFKNLIIGTHFGCAENPSQREFYPTINPYFDPPPNMNLINAVQDYIEKTNCSVTWCYGHSHINENRESIYGGVIRTNQIGYPKEATKLGITNPFTFKRVL